VSEPLTSSSLKWLAEKAVDLIAERVKKKVLTEVNPELERIEENLKDIRDAQEQKLVAPLIEGLSQFRLNKFDKAVDNLVRARALNPHAPVPRRWLALVLSQQSEYRSEAYKYLAEAIELNPYCLSDGSDDLSLQSVSPTEEYGAPNWKHSSKPWSLSLSNEKFTDELKSRFKWPKRTFQKYLGMYSSRSTAAIVKASVCGGRVAVQWLMADNLRHRTEEVMALFELKSQKPLWAHLNKKEDLTFLSYRHVVVYRRESDSFLLLDFTNGDSAKKMSRNYFDAMFAHGNSESAPFIRANWHGTLPKDAYEKSAKFVEPRLSTMDTTFGHFPRLFSEGAELNDPCGLSTPTFTVLNRWNHYHFRGGATLLPSCRLVGGAAVSCGEPIRSAVDE